MAINPINKFYQVLKRYPGNNKQWWVARATSDDPEKGIKAGDFMPDLLDKMYSGNNRAPRGHYILDAFRKDRSAVSGVKGIAVENEKTRPNATCFFSGRAWYASNSKIYYSQILDHKSKAGLCYQEADPTSEDISDLIDSDGGVIPIPEASKICRLMPIGNGVVVFALNGVWYISGGSEAFKATNVSVGKISAIGTKSPMSIVVVDETIYWWSEVGIHALEQSSGQFGPIPGKFGNTNIAEQTIQTFYNEIDGDAKNYVKGIYDTKNNVIQWLYSSEGNMGYRYDRILLYDVTLQAFYPWSISSPEGDVTPMLTGVFMNNGILETTFQEDITDNNGDVVSTISLDNVTTLVYNTTVENRPTNLTYSAALGSDITFAKFDDRTYVDWKTFDGEGASYSSYVETGYELLEDAMRKKQAVRVFVHFRRTEDDAFSIPSSCTMRTKWEWSANQNSNKWSRPIQAYRPRQMRIETTADLESGFPVVISNNKVRGSGKSIQFRFECSEPNKNFDLLGWSVAYVGNTES